MTQITQKHQQPQITLGTSDIDLWLVRPDEITDRPLLLAYDKLMSQSERDKQQRYKFAQDRHDALVTRAFVRTLLSAYELPTVITPEQWQFSKGDKGKPEISNQIYGPARQSAEAVTPVLRFNLSHTKGLIVCAVVWDVDIGVDVEYIPRKTSPLKIARYKFSDLEIAELNAQPVENQRKRFFDYWTLKESYIKAVGQGLAIPLDQFSFMIIDDQNIRMSIDEQRNDDASQWQSWLLQGTAAHRIALSIKDPRSREFNLRYFESLPLIKRWPVQLPLTSSSAEFD